MPSQTRSPTILSVTSNTGTLLWNEGTIDNVKVADGVFTSIAGDATENPVTWSLIGTAFGFSIPINATITKISLRLKCYTQLANSALENVITVPYLWTNGAFSVSIPSNITSWPESLGFDVCELTSNLPTPAQVNLSNSGISFQAQPYHPGGVTSGITMFVDSMEMIVDYEPESEDEPVSISWEALDVFTPGVEAGEVMAGGMEAGQVEVLNN